MLVWEKEGFLMFVGEYNDDQVKRLLNQIIYDIILSSCSCETQQKWQDCQ